MARGGFRMCLLRKKGISVCCFLPSEFCGLSSSFLHPQGGGKRKWCGAVTAVRIRLQSAMKSMVSRKFLLSSCIFYDALVL